MKCFVFASMKNILEMFDKFMFVSPETGRGQNPRTGFQISLSVSVSSADAEPDGGAAV